MLQFLACHTRGLHGGGIGVLAVYITRHDYDLDAGQACSIDF